MKVKMEKQLNFLLPINNSRSKSIVGKAATVNSDKGYDDGKRYIKIKESLINKGLVKSR